MSAVGRAAGLVALVAMGTPGCGAVPPQTPRTEAASPEGAGVDAARAAPRDAPAPRGAATPSGVPAQRGRATYYSDRLAGRPTASGEPYDPRDLTAAHRKLPFGAVVDVIRTDGRRVRVRINDRGPFGKGRIIDLSRRAAEAIGLLREGVADVTVEVVSLPARAARR